MDLSLDADLTFSVDVPGAPTVTGHLTGSGTALELQVDNSFVFAGRRDAAILRLFIDTGARRAEVANLRWTPADPDTNDIDLDAGLVRVLGKGRRERLLSIGMKTVKSLDRYLRLREGHAAAATPWLWLGLKGRLTDSGIAQMVAEVLRRDGHEILLASSGREALARLETAPVDLILSDLRMPDLDGPDLYRELTARSPALARRMVFVTGDVLTPETGSFLSKAALPVLEKPLDPYDLRLKVRAYLADLGRA